MKILMLPLAVLLLLPGPPVEAQQSASYRLEEHTFNSGGHPADGQVMASPGFRLSFDALGEPVVDRGMGGETYALDASFASSYPPPGEVAGLGFTDRQTLAWDPERSAGTYAVYRGRVVDLFGLGYGGCLAGGVAGETATDSDLPAAHDGFFYLVTASNTLDEEGTKGMDSTGAERSNDAPCP